MNNSFVDFFFSTEDPIRRVYASVDCFVLFFGISLNAILAYLILCKTVAAMKIYKKLLLLSCAMDMVVCCCTFIVQPIPCVENGYRTVLMNGMFRHFSQPIRYAIYVTWLHCMLFILILTMFQYIYRFCILCKNGMMPAKVFWSMIGFLVLINVCHASFITWADYPRENELAKQNELREMISRKSGLTDIQFIAFVNAQAFRWLLHIALMFVIFPGFYFVIIFCIIRIHQFVDKMNVLKVQEYNRQVSAALLFQAFMPTLEIFAWCIQIFVPVFMNNQSTVMFVVFSDIPVHLVPVLNPIGTIVLVAPYRRAIFRYLGLRKWEQTTTVQIISQQNQSYGKMQTE